MWWGPGVFSQGPPNMEGAGAQCIKLTKMPMCTGTWVLLILCQIAFFFFPNFCFSDSVSPCYLKFLCFGFAFFVLFLYSFFGQNAKLTL